MPKQRNRPCPLSAALADIEEFRIALAWSDSPRAHAFLAALDGPRHRKCALPALALKYGLKRADLAYIWNRYMLAKAELEIYRAFPELCDELILAAKAISVCCPSCSGEGERQSARTGEWKICPGCAGGKISRQPGDHQAMRVLFAMCGWGTKGAAIRQSAIQPYGLETVMDEIDRLEASPGTYADIRGVPADHRA